MSQSSVVSPSKKGYVASAAMSFVGMLAAVPVVMMLFSPNAPANASPNNGSNYDQFAYAYTQGYLASANTGNVNTDGCGEGAVMPTGGMGSLGGEEGSGAVAMAGGGGAVAAANFVPGRGNIGGGGNVSPQTVTPAEMANIIRESYNTYNYVNSNNTIGSNNSTSNSVAVSDSKNVHIDTDTETNVTNDVNNIAVSDSFNHDSHDTVTNTTNTAIAVDDSFNHVDVDDSGNTVTVVKDSGNTDNTTINKTEETNTTTTVVTAIDDSFNTVDNSHQNDNGPENTPLVLTES